MQPRVAKNELPWVDDVRNQNPNGVSAMSRGGEDTTALRLMIYDGAMTQGSSFLATAGLRARIPLGFSNGTPGREKA